MVEPTRCSEIADALAEVATGAASGLDRALILGHLAGCDDCRRELDELTRVADEVLLVAPEHEPPAGFEGAVLARIADLSDQPEAERSDVAGPNRRRRVVRSLALAAAAVVIGFGGAGTVWIAGSDDREQAAGFRETLAIADGRYFTAAPVLDAADTQVGHVFLYDGEPSWVFAVLGNAPEPGTYDILVVTDNGTEQVATCDVETATCSAGATIDADINQINEVRLVMGNGTPLTAIFPAPRS